MAGDTFDAGTVHAEARLGRDQFQKDLDQLRRDMARFERETFRVRVGINQTDLDSGVASARRDLNSLNRESANPRVGVNDKTFTSRMFSIRASLKQVHEIVSTPLILVDIVQSLARVAKLKYELAEMSKRYVIDLVIYPQAYREVNRVADSLLSLKNVARSILPVLTPLLGGIAGSAVTIASSLGAAGGAAAVFGVAAIPALAGVAKKQQDIADAQQKVNETQKHAGFTDKQRATALLNLEVALGRVSAQEQQAVKDIGAIKGAWETFQIAIQPVVFELLNKSVGMITKGLPLLTPVITAVAEVFGGWMIDLERGIDNGGLKKFMDWLTGPGVDSLDLWVRALGNFAVGFVNILMGSQAHVTDFNEGLLSMSQRFLAWSQTLEQNQQWQEWLRFSAAVMPDVLTILGQLIGILMAVHRTFAPITEAVLGFVASFMQAHPQLTQFLVVGFVVSQFLMGLVGIFAGVILKVLLFAAIFGRISAVFQIARTAQLLWSALVIRDFTMVGRLAMQLFTQIMRLTFIGRLFTFIANATKIWAAAQWLLNSALLANPLTWIVIAIIALVAALVLAYQHSETFRNIVQAAWAGIQQAAIWAWENGIKPVVDWLVQAWNAIAAGATWLWQSVIVPAWAGIVSAVQAAGQWFQWLWNTIIKPVFDFIGLAARVLLAVLVTIVLAPIILAVKAVGAIFTWLWENAVKPAWDGIVAGATAAWGFLQPILAAIGTFITTNVGAAWTWLSTTVTTVWTAITTAVSVAWAWLRDNIFVPLIDFIVGQLSASFEGWKILAIGVWDAISTGIGIAWAFIRDNVWNPIVQFIDTYLSPAFQRGSDLAISAWNTLRDALMVVWNFLRDNIFNPIITFVQDNIVAAFNRAIEGIKGAWEKIQGIVGPPIKFMVGVVYNEGIVPAWNWIAGLVNLPKIEPVNLGFHSGGVVPGPSNPYSDNRLARVNGGEAIMRPEFTRAVGPNYIDQMNRLAMSGGPRAVQRALNSGTIVEGADHNGPGSSTVGFGGVRPHVAQAGHYLKSKFGIGVVGGVGARANASDHPKGLALDFMTSGENGTALADFVRGGANKQHFGVTYVIWRQRIDSGSGWRGMANRGSPTANHMDHVHVSFGGPGGGPMDGGVGFITELTAMWNKVLDFMKRINEFTGTQWGSGTMGMLKKLVDGAWGFLSGRAMGGGPATNTGPAGAAGPGAGNFFDQGGIIPPGTSVVHNKTGKPELAGRLDQWATLIDSARVSRPDDGGTGNLSAASVERLTATMIEIRDMLERRGAGATINMHGVQGNPTENGRAAALAIKLS